MKLINDTMAKEKQRINFLELLISLWPGDWKKQLARLNLRIRVDNESCG
jgi:hypothetical protein